MRSPFLERPRVTFLKLDNGRRVPIATYPRRRPLARMRIELVRLFRARWPVLVMLAAIAGLSIGGCLGLAWLTRGAGQ
jgi:hypothetical protein